MMVVCLDNIYVRRINKISQLRCRTIIIGRDVVAAPQTPQLGRGAQANFGGPS